MRAARLVVLFVGLLVSCVVDCDEAVPLVPAG